MTYLTSQLPHDSNGSVSPLSVAMRRARDNKTRTSGSPLIKEPSRPASVHYVLPPGFYLRTDGYYFKGSDDKASSIKICGPFTIVAQARSQTSDNWSSVFDFNDPDGHHHRHAVPRTLLAGDGAEMRGSFLSRGLDIETSRDARAKFSELIAGIKTDRRALAVECPGWSGEVFVTADRSFGNKADQLVIYAGADSLNHPFRSAGTLEEWQDKVGRLAVGNSRVTVAIAAAFVGPCLALLGEEGGGFHFRGPSSIGKSTALFAAASPWGPERFVLPWRATMNGLEGSCVLHNETVLLLDEVAAVDPKDAGTAAYLISNGVGKARANRSGALRSSASWRVIFLSSGEISLAEHAGRDARGAKKSAAGQDVRICDIPADAGAGLGLFENLNGAENGDALARQIKAGCRSAYGTAGPAFVEHLIANRENAISELKAAIDEFSKANVPARADGQVARVARRFGMVAAVGELGIKAGVLPWPKHEARNACAIVFRDWLKGRGGLGSAEDRDAIAKVRAYLEMHGSSRFEPLEDEDETLRINNRAGFWRESADKGREYLFLPETWKTDVCAGMDASRVTKVLAEKGFLRKDSQGKNSISVVLPHKQGKARCYAVNSSIFAHEEMG